MIFLILTYLLCSFVYPNMPSILPAKGLSPLPPQDHEANKTGAPLAVESAPDFFFPKGGLI